MNALTKTLVAVVVLSIFGSVAAETAGQPVGADAANSALNFLLGLNPLILIAAGVLLFFAANLAKVIAVILVIIGAVSLLVSLI